MHAFRRVPAPIVALSAFLLVGLHDKAAATSNFSARRMHIALPGCLLMADPHVHKSFVPPPRPHAALRGPGAEPAQTSASITVSYTGFTPEAQAAFQYAVDIWAAQISSPVAMQIQAQLMALDPGVLGSAGPSTVWYGVPNGVANTLYPVAIANRLAGYDLDVSGADIEAHFSSTADWYYGTDGQVPAGKYDFVTVVLHELGHGLGFLGSGAVSGSAGFWGYSVGGTPMPMIFDRFVSNGSGQSILDTAAFPNGSALLKAQLSGDNLFLRGPATLTATSGTGARLYAPGSFSNGSSYSHLNEATYGVGNRDSLMTPVLSSAEAIHDPGPVVRAVFADSGWLLNTTPTCSYNVSRTPATFPSGGGSGTVSITTSAGCPWSVTSDQPWLTFTSAASGSGSGSVTFAVSANPSSMDQTATITAAGQPLSVTVAGRACSFSLSAPAILTFGAGGGTSGVALTASAPDCAWAASSSVPWLHVPATGTGSGIVAVTATGAGASTRTGALSIAGLIAVARQNGHATVAFDVNHDGGGDALAYDPSTGSHFFSLADPRNLGFDDLTPALWSTGWSIFAGDFDGDGRSDLFFYNPTSGRAVKAISTGTETFRYTELAWSAGWQITVADLNGDRRDDVFVYNAMSGRWFRCISQPDDSFTYTTGALWSPNWSVYAGDFNGDGRADLFLYNATSDVNHGRWFRVLSNADESVAYVEGDTIWRNDWTVTPGDFDGDGITDLLLYRSTGEWYRVLFTAGGPRYDQGVWSPGWSISRGDFNGDGRADLFVYNPSIGRWFVVISDASAIWAYYGGTVDWSPGWQISVTDVNVDGRDDLLLYSPADGRWFQAVTTTPGNFEFASGAWTTGLQILATRPQLR